MSGLVSFLLFAALFFFMMRFGCGAHAGHGGHGAHGSTGEDRDSMQGPTQRTLAASVDPVCGMRVDADMGYAKMHRGNSYRFCSRDCLDKFEANPDKYVPVGAQGISSPMGHEHPEHRT